MKNIFILEDNKSFLPPEILNFSGSISLYFPIHPNRTPIQTFLLNLANCASASITNPLTALTDALISFYAQSNYIKATDYAKVPLAYSNINPSLYKISNTSIADNIYKVFDTNSNGINLNNEYSYINELADFLMLSYNYSNSLKKIPIQDIKNPIVCNYLEILLKKDGIEPRTFSDMRWRQTKANNKKPILPLFIDKNTKKFKFDSYFDIEILLNLFRSTNKSKNPFLTNIKSDKLTKIDQFLGSFQHISLKEVFLDLPNSIAPERLFSHHQFILERLTNINFIIFLYAVIASVKQEISPLLLDELYCWSTFPLLNTRLRLLISIFIILSKETLSLKKQELLQLLLRAIRLYHFKILLPLLVHSFHYAAYLFFNEKEIKDKTLKREFRLFKRILRKEDQRKINTLLSPQKSINEYLKEYFSSSSVSQRLMYFGVTKDEKNSQEKLYPIAYKIYQSTLEKTLKELFDKIHECYISPRLLSPINNIGSKVYNKFSEQQQIFAEGKIVDEKTLCNSSCLSPYIFNDIYFYPTNWGVNIYY